MDYIAFFPAFPQLPPEIRQQIWRIAVDSSWSFTKLGRMNRLNLNGQITNCLKLVGEIHPEVGQSCREARAVMQSMSTNLTNTLGSWIDFSHHLLFVRDSKFDRGVITYVDEQCGILPHVRHVVLNPRDWGHLWDTINVMKLRCASLHSLIVVAPWFDPLDMPARHTSVSYAPYEDWGPLFRKTPAENALHKSAILDDIVHGTAANATRNAEYYGRVADAARQAQSDGVAQLEHVFGRTHFALDRLEQVIQDFPSRKPELYLRRRDQLVHC